MTREKTTIKRSIALAFIAIVVDGCSDRLTWTRSETTADQFTADSTECVNQLLNGRTPYWEEVWYQAPYMACMTNRGYILKDTGVQFGPRTFEFQSS